MRTKKSFYVELLLLALLFLGSLFDYLNVTTTLFYFSIEVFVFSSIAAIFYLTNKPKGRALSVFLAGLFMTGFASTYILFLAEISGDIYTFGLTAEVTISDFMIKMASITWPMIILRFLFVFFRTRSLEAKEKEENFILELIRSVFTIIIICIVSFILLFGLESTSTEWIVFAIIGTKLAVELFMYRSVLFPNKFPETKKPAKK